MDLQVTARHFEAPASLHEHARQRLAKLERFYDGILDAHVVLEKGGTPPDDKTAEISLNVYQKRLAATAGAASHTQAIDDCVKRLRRQLLKYKDKLKSKDQDRY